MSINITKSSDSKKSTTPVNIVPDFVQPRDERGRFTSPEAKEQIFENARKLNEKEVKQLKSLNMNEIEWTAPYIYNFIKDNGIVKKDIAEGQVSACIYLNKGTESWYCFLTPNTAYGFHLSCGILAEVLNREEVMNLLPKYNILYWDAIQRV